MKLDTSHLINMLALTFPQMLCTPVANDFDECFLIRAELALTCSVQVLEQQRQARAFKYKHKARQVDRIHLNKQLWSALQ